MIRRLALAALIATLTTSAVAMVAPAAQAAGADVAWVTQEKRPTSTDYGFGVALAPDGKAVYDLVTRGTRSVDLVKRRTSNGEVIWRRTVDATRYSVGLAVETTSTGDVVVLAARPDTGGYSAYVASFTPRGTMTWLTPVARQVVSPSQGQLAIGPRIHWALRSGYSPDTSIRFGAVTKAGTWTWGKRYDTPWNERVFDLMWTKSAGLLLAGDTEADLGGEGKGTGTAFVWHLRASDGTVVDVNSFTGEGFVAGQALAQGPDGTVYFALIEKIGTQVAEIWTIHRDGNLDTRVMTFTADELMQSVRGIFVDATGFVFVGSARGGVDGATGAVGSDDVYVLRSNLTGTKRSTVMFGSGASDVAWRAVRVGNRLYVGGYTAGDMATGAGSPTATRTDPFVASVAIPSLPR